jgi:large subunit ribosomal protein L16
MESGLIRENAIEAARKAVRKAVRKAAKLRFCLNPFLGVTEKPSEVRMGKGKGKLEYHAYPVAKGKILFELTGIPWYKGKVALKRGQVKIPLKTKVIILKDLT